MFNFGKCKCLHKGHGDLDVNYEMGDTVLGATVKEKDFGVAISADVNNGPNTDPCGTSIKTEFQFETAHPLNDLFEFCRSVDAIMSSPIP